jgi:hypothetical protein
VAFHVPLRREFVEAVLDEVARLGEQRGSQQRPLR